MRDYENLEESQLIWLLKFLVILLIVLVVSTIGFCIGLLIRTFIGG